jgi:hypothetical protein
VRGQCKREIQRRPAKKKNRKRAKKTKTMKTMEKIEKRRRDEEGLPNGSKKETQYAAEQSSLVWQEGDAASPIYKDLGKKMSTIKRNEEGGKPLTFRRILLLHEPTEGIWKIFRERR